MNKDIIKEVVEIIGDYPVQPVLSKQCGQACAALITKKPIDLVCKEMDKVFSTNIYTDLVPYIRAQGFEIAVTATLGSGITLDKVPNDSLIRLQKNDGGGHFVVKRDNIYIDPSGEIVLAYSEKKYKLSHYAPFKKIKN